MDINDVQITQNMIRPKDEELNICERLYRQGMMKNEERERFRN
jgi:hypothetical protein